MKSIESENARMDGFESGVLGVLKIHTGELEEHILLQRRTSGRLHGFVANFSRQLVLGSKMGEARAMRRGGNLEIEIDGHALFVDVSGGAVKMSLFVGVVSTTVFPPTAKCSSGV